MDWEEGIRVCWEFRTAREVEMDGIRKMGWAEDRGWTQGIGRNGKFEDKGIIRHIPSHFYDSESQNYFFFLFLINDIFCTFMVFYKIPKYSYFQTVIILSIQFN